MYPLDYAIENAFAISDYLVVELNPMTADQTKLLQKGMYQGNKTVKDDLSDEAFTMLKDYLEKNNIPVAGFIKLKPGMITMMLESLQLMKLGFSPGYGIDMHFIKKAQGVKPIFELETIDEQLNQWIVDR